jgi:hypothetical protein
MKKLYDPFFGEVAPKRKRLESYRGGPSVQQSMPVLNVKDAQVAAAHWMPLHVYCISICRDRSEPMHVTVKFPTGIPVGTINVHDDTPVNRKLSYLGLIVNRLLAQLG